MTGVAALSDRLVEFVSMLRDHGITAGPSETVDAASAVASLGLADRELLRSGLAATLLRRNGQRAVFDQIFDVYFPVSGRLPELHGTATPSAEQVDDLREQLIGALAAGDDDTVARLAEQALTALGGYGRLPAQGEGPGGGGSGSSGGGSATASPAGWSSYLTLKHLHPDDLADRIAAAMVGRHAEALDGAVATIEAQRRLGGFRSAVEAESRRRAAQLRGAARIARNVEKSTDQVSFLSASETQLAEMRRLVYPLARKLATRLAARRRKAVHGQIDFRRTIRKSMATGGVPMRPVLRARRHGRPELVVLADLSGSVAGFAEFTLQLVAALQDQFSKVRSFGFIDICDEITDLVRGGDVPDPGLARRIVRHAGVARWGNSNYGDAFASFVDQYLDALGPRTSLLVLGDARTNYGDPNLSALRAMVDRTRHAYWLNPEAASTWSTGDSVADRYGAELTMFECRNVRQLAEVIARILPS
ncbi:MAG: VWA domain-containing protein [Mycobacteriaceae bacterium]|nr:VWA domain-containing protein [Mycobacteriaceae bacterium]